jgi:signal transduction histidine kinase
VADTVAEFGDIAVWWYGRAINGINAAALAAYFAVFLTPKKGGRLPPLLLTGASCFAFEYVWGLFFGDSALLTILETAAFFAITSGITAFCYKPEFLKQLFLLFSYHAVKWISLLLMTHLSFYFQPFRRYADSIMANADISPIIIEQLSSNVKISIAAQFSLNAFLYALFVFVSIWGIAKGFTYRKRRLRTAEALSLILPCLPVFVIIFAVRVFIESGADIAPLWDSYGILISLSSVFLLLTIIFSVVMAQKSVKLYLEEKNAAVFREQVHEMQKRDAGIYAEIRGMRHDMKNHLSNIRFMLKPSRKGGQENAEDLNSYFAKMNETMERFEIAFQTGNPVTDAVVHGQYLKAKDRMIRFKCEFAYPASDCINAYDLAVILQNALENAAEACEGVSGNVRFINLRSRQKAGTFFVEISNSYSGEISFDSQSGLPYTTKADAVFHGLGLSNIKRSAKNMGGDIAINLSEEGEVKVFTLTVILPVA